MYYSAIQKLYDQVIRELRYEIHYNFITTQQLHKGSFAPIIYILLFV